MQVIFDDEKSRKEIERLKQNALDNIQDFTNGIPENHRPIGDNKDFVLKNGNIRVVYSIEKQPSGLYHHISISKQKINDLNIYNSKMLPHEEMVNHFLKAIGLGDLSDGKDRKIWIEENFAINILQPIYVWGN